MAGRAVVAAHNRRSVPAPRSAACIILQRQPVISFTRGVGKFEIDFRQSLLEVERAGRPLPAILFDVDFFKQVSDTYGHLAGDRITKSVAQLAKGVVRERDVVPRWGGEEFLILLMECPLGRAAGVAGKLCGVINGGETHASPKRLMPGGAGWSIKNRRWTR